VVVASRKLKNYFSSWTCGRCRRMQLFSTSEHSQIFPLFKCKVGYLGESNLNNKTFSTLQMFRCFHRYAVQFCTWFCDNRQLMRHDAQSKTPKSWFYDSPLQIWLVWFHHWCIHEVTDIFIKFYGKTFNIYSFICRLQGEVCHKTVGILTGA